MFRTRVIPMVAMATISVACIAGAKPESETQALLEARTYKYQFRAGQFERAQDALAVIKAAADRAPDNVEVLNELGTAYFMQITAAAHSKADPQTVATAPQNALNAFERALEIDPANAYATGGRGMARNVIAALSRSTEGRGAGIADLNRAVELAPSSIPVRLMRAFSSLALPPALRHEVAVEEDLGFLMNVADGTRAGDVVTVLLADMQWENGRREEAQRTYERVVQRTNLAGDLARARLETLRTAQAPPVEEMTKLRRNVGRDCTQCHGR